MLKLVVFPALDAARLKRLQTAVPDLSIVNCSTIDEAVAEIATADGFYGKLTPALLRAATQLTWVQSPTASLEHYLFPALVEHPCRLSNMRGLFSDVIADHVMGLILCFARNLQDYIRQQADGRWAPIGDAAMVADFVSTPGTVTPVDRAHQHLGDLTLGVVGVGAIGAEILRRARAFGMTLRGVDPQAHHVEDLALEIAPFSELPALLGACDYVVIAAPHTPVTEGLFNRTLIQQMRRSAILINIGRGAIVSSDDLAAALTAGEIAGAALDVCDREPLPSEHPLWRMPNVLITPHVAAASPRIAERHFAVLQDNFTRFARGETPRNLVDKRAWF